VFNVCLNAPRLGQAEQIANEAILALVDFPKQIVQALSTAVNHMKGRYLMPSELISDFGLENAFRNRSTFTKVGNVS
jgi:hypothetical protein